MTSRRAALGLFALALAGATALGSGQARAQVSPAPAQLIVGDVAAASLYVFGAPEFQLLASFDDIAFGAHAGVVALPDGRVLIPDDRNKQLVVLKLGTGAPTIEKRVPMPIPLPSRYAWAAVDPSQSVYAATNLDSDESVKILTLVDLKTYATKQFRIDVGAADAELNFALGGDPEPVVILHLAEKAESYRVADLMAAGAKINGILDGTIKPASTLPLGKGGHSDSFSAASKRWTGSTLRGFEIATLKDAALTEHKTLSWEADERGGGRNARQRLTADGGHVFGPLAASVPPAQWAEAEVDLHWVDLAKQTARRMPLAKGAVGRGGVSEKLAVYASIHSDGDHANLVDVDPASASFRQVVGRVTLPKLVNGPVPGKPTAGAEGRHSAITPDGRLAFVTQGGEGKVAVIDTATKAVVRTIETPTPLKGGAYVVGVQMGAVSADLSAR
ncbi:hypothetical protein BHK69_30575 (plasmid) [Bosea vaviloviae]|uniref:Uncharacterized protein n=2 Tax=Bosea vaviloviae TaxID=1526658 RepID=A0A1D7UCE9_9HYPH|nr:hypothetical protein BHK69_30575 [Bosea vaviloviae]